MSKNFDWWKEAIAIEYLNCRDFSKYDSQSDVYGFKKINDNELENIREDIEVVSYGTIYHNVQKLTYDMKNIALWGGVSESIVDGDVLSFIPNGLVSDYHFNVLLNPLKVYDPIWTFNQYIQVMDHGELYQWKVAELYTNRDNNQIHFTSDYVDLSPLEKFYNIKNELLKIKSLDPDNYPKKAELLIEELLTYRRKILFDFKCVHKCLKKRNRNADKTIDFKPPLITHFETMKVESNKMYIKANLIPLFYHSTLKHVRKLKELELECFSSEKKNSIYIFERIHEEKIESIIMACAFLEAFINDIGFKEYKNVWSTCEKLGIKEKFEIVFYFNDANCQSMFSEYPFQHLKKIIQIRNKMIHYKIKYTEVKVNQSDSLSPLSNMLDSELLKTLPNILIDIVKLTCDKINIAPPKWLDYQFTGWAN